MSCCGKKRTEYVQQSVNNNYVQPTSEYTPTKIFPDVNFEYVGATGLTVTGSITGNRYRFAQTGEVQLIDYRDVGGMMAVSVLKKVN